MNLQTVVLCVLLGLSPQGINASYCSQSTVQDCMQPITDFRHKLGISDELKYFPIYKLNATQLDSYCVFGAQVSHCLSDLDDCSNVDRLTFEGFRDCFHYLCKESLEEYKSHQRCYAKTQVISGLEACTQQTTDKINSFNFHEYDAKDEFCGIVDEDGECIRKTVEPECGKKAADWQVNYLNKAISPAMSLVGCSSLPRFVIWAIIAIVCVAVSVTVTLTIRCIKARRQAPRADVNFHNVLSTGKVV